MPPTDYEFSGPLAHAFDYLWSQFRQDYAALAQFLNVLRVVNDAYEVQVDVAEQLLDPESTDPGDVYYKATKLLGLDPYEVAGHTGLMMLARGAGLYETYVARVASQFFSDSEGIVYIGGRSWTRGDADKFFGTCLNRPMRPWRGSMKWIAQLRDLYAHGYGEPLSTESATLLAGELWRIARFEEAPTDEESKIGLGEGQYLFGPHSDYSPKAGIQTLSFSTVSFALSPLTTHRLLGEIESAMREVFEAASWWTKNDLSPENNAFLRGIEKKLTSNE